MDSHDGQRETSPTITEGIQGGWTHSISAFGQETGSKTKPIPKKGPDKPLAVHYGEALAFKPYRFLIK
jgi:hypothetical protein